MDRGGGRVGSGRRSRDERACRDEAERGEDSGLKRYRTAGAKDLPADVKAVVQKQLQGTQANHDQIKALRDRAKAAAA